MRIFSIDNENALYTQAAMHGGCFDLQKIVDDDKENLFSSFHNENSVDNENALCPQAAIHGGCFDVQKKFDDDKENVFLHNENVFC